MGNISEDDLKLAAFFVVVSTYWLFWWVLGPYRWLMYPVGLPLALLLLLFFYSFLNRYLVSFAATAVAIFAILLLTVVITQTDSEVCQGMVVKKWTESRMAYYTPISLDMVKVRCDEPKVLTFETSIMSSLYDALKVGKPVEIAYHTEPVLGIPCHNQVLESLDSRSVFSSRGLFPLINFVIGVLPLSYLIYAQWIRNRIRAKGTQLN